MHTQDMLIAGAPIGTLDYGIGVNWFDHLGTGGLYARAPEYPLTAQVLPPLDDERAWAVLFDELTRLRPGCIRFGLPPDQVLDEAGKLRTDSLHFARLDQVDRWCAAHGAVLIIDTFFIPRRFEFPVPPELLDPPRLLNMAARDNRTYARTFVAPLLHHLLIERGLQTIALFNPVNEPLMGGIFQMPADGPDMYRHYVEMYAEIRQALDAIGLAADRIGLAGIDTYDILNFPLYEFAARGIDIDPHLAAYSIHAWFGRFDYAAQTTNTATYPLHILIDTYVRRLARYTTERGKPLLALEVGAFQYGWMRGDPAGPATPDGALLTAEVILRMINVGVRGAMIWSLFNPDDIDGWWSIFGVTGAQVERAPHRYSAFQMLMHHAPRGSQVYPLAPREREYPVQHVWGTAFCAPNGQRHLLVINDHPTDQRDISLALPPAWDDGPYRKIIKDRVRLGSSAGSFALGHEQMLCDTLGPMSLNVYTNAPDERAG